MRSRDHIMASISKDDWVEDRDDAILEVLLDVRELLTKMQGASLYPLMDKEGRVVVTFAPCLTEGV